MAAPPAAVLATVSAETTLATEESSAGEGMTLVAVLPIARGNWTGVTRYMGGRGTHPLDV